MTSPSTAQRLGLARAQLILLGEYKRGESSGREERRQFYRDLIAELEASLPSVPERVERRPYKDDD